MKKLTTMITALGLGALLAACGGSSTDPAASTGSEPAAEAAETSVRIAMFRFQPDPIEVAPGTTITWSNEDQILHTVTSGTPEAPTGEFDEEMPDVGASATITFDEPGAYPYFCARHEHMRGEVLVG